MVPEAIERHVAGIVDGDAVAAIVLSEALAAMDANQVRPFHHGLGSGREPGTEADGVGEGEEVNTGIPRRTAVGSRAGSPRSALFFRAPRRRLKKNGAPATVTATTHIRRRDVTRNHGGQINHKKQDMVHHTNGHHAHGSDRDAAAAVDFTTCPGQPAPGEETVWHLRFRDAATNEPIRDVVLSHGKPVHLIVVSADLAWFNHLHPEPVGDGTFTLTTTVPRAGEYVLYADFESAELGPLLVRHEFVVGDHVAQPNAPTPLGNGWDVDRPMVQLATAHPEGEPDSPTDVEYQVAMTLTPPAPIAGNDVMIRFQIRDDQGTPVPDLEPYLGTRGHAVLLSGDTKTYLHVHPVDHTVKEGGSGADVAFHTNFPRPGLYKVWGQFQHRGMMITESFVVDAR